MAILRRTEKTMMRAMCGVKMIEKRSQKLMSLLGLMDTLDGLARASGVQWYGHVLRRSQELMSLLGLKDTLDGLARASGVQWFGHVLR